MTPASALAAPARLDLRAHLGLLLAGGHTIELFGMHVPAGRQGAPAKIVGYARDVDAAVGMLEAYGGAGDYYATCNPVDPALFDRAPHRWNRGHTRAKASEIVARRFFFVDVDAVRPKDAPATADERARAGSARDAVCSFLHELGWPPAVRLDSPNGAYVLAALDVPLTAAVDRLVVDALAALQERFSDATVKLDAVADRNRLHRLAGTGTTKGTPTHERPHRRCALVHVPTPLVPATLEAVETLAGLARRRRRLAIVDVRDPLQPSRGAGLGPTIDWVAEFQARDLYRRPAEDGRRHYVGCPWAAEHSSDSGISETVLLAPTDEIEIFNFKCLHAHCAGRGLGDVARLWGLHGDGLMADLVADVRAAKAAEAAASPAAADVAPAGAIPTPDRPRRVSGPGWALVTPPEAFISKYVAWARDCTDAPAAAHELQAVGVLAALAGPRPRLRLNIGDLPLTIWTLYIVNSTIGRKSTVLQLAQDVVRDVLGGEAIINWEGSPQGLLQRLAERDGQALVFCRDELSGLVDQMSRPGHLAALPQLLIRGYDVRPLDNLRTKKTASDGRRVDDTDSAAEPYLVLLTAAVRDEFVRAATPAHVQSGLLPRFLMVAGEATPAPLKGWSVDREVARACVLQHARAFAARAQHATVHVAPTVLAAHFALEASLATGAGTALHAALLRPALKRLSDAALKVAGLLALDLAPAGAEVTVTRAHWDVAEALVRRWRPHVEAVLVDVGQTAFSAMCRDVCATVKQRPGIALSDLYRAHRQLRVREFGEALNALEIQERVRREVVRGSVGRPPTRVWPVP